MIGKHNSLKRLHKAPMCWRQVAMWAVSRVVSASDCFGGFLPPSSRHLQGFPSVSLPPVDFGEFKFATLVPLAVACLLCVLSALGSLHCLQLLLRADACCPSTRGTAGGTPLRWNLSRFSPPVGASAYCRDTWGRPPWGEQVTWCLLISVTW